jgi:hypothetical protein
MELDMVAGCFEKSTFSWFFETKLFSYMQYVKVSVYFDNLVLKVVITNRQDGTRCHYVHACVIAVHSGD